MAIESPINRIARLSVRGENKPSLAELLSQCEGRIAYALKRKLRERDMPHFNKLLERRKVLMEQIEALPIETYVPDYMGMQARADARDMKQGARPKRPTGFKTWSLK